MHDSNQTLSKAKTQQWLDSVNTAANSPNPTRPTLSTRSSSLLSPISTSSPLSPTSNDSSQSSAPPRTPLSSIFGSVKGIASSALRIAQHAIDAQEDSSLTSHHLRPTPTRSDSSFREKLQSGVQSGMLVKDALVALNDVINHPSAIDDRKMLLEDVITLLYSLPPDSKIGDTLGKTLIRLLWNDLEHPPISYLGKAKYRSADGSGNNFQNPQLGAAGHPYARSVASQHPLSQQLSDNAAVWDTLMKRDKFTPHPSGISSLLFAFATCITHTLFSTNRQDPSINDASSYLDLSPLYGNNQQEQNQIRTFRDGKIFEDVIASQRLFLMPPSTCALMIIFSRNHNWIAETLLRVNQNNKFKPFELLSPEQRKRQDEDLFQTARLVNCGWFLQVIFHDYIRVILNINQTESDWTLVPTGVIDSTATGKCDRGVGNAVSVEFNLLYRWHSCIGEKDTQYLETLMRRYSRTPFDEMTEEEFVRILRGTAMEMGADCKKWTFGGLKRQGKDGTGRFDDDDLVRVLTEATDEVAGAFKARGVPAAMKIIDIMGMNMARNEWACATLNEFRSFLKLSRYESFEDWNPDPVIADAARKLYEDIDNLEIVPGLAAEEAKPSQNGAGLTPGYTISRAILSDAVALVRGDRFFTVDYTSANLTSFLYRDLESESKNGAFGGALGKLLMRTFPRHYTYNSTYALFPFSTPSTTNGILQRLKLIDQYDTRRPSPPPEWIVVDKRSIAESILSPESTTSSNFEPVYGAPLDVLKQEQPSFLTLVSSFKTKVKSRSSSQEVIDKAFFPSQFTNLVVASIAPRAKELVSKHSWSCGGGGAMRINLVQQVIVPVCMGWISDQLGFPLKTEENPRGLLTCHELYDTLCEAYSYVHLNYDASQGFKLRNSVIKNTSVLKSVIDFRLAEANGSSKKVHDLAQDIKEILLGEKSGQRIVMSNNARKVYDRVLENSSRPLEEISDTLLFSMINSVSSVTACAKSIDFFLRPENADRLRDLHSQTAVDVGLANDSTIQHYVNEALRLDPPVGGFVRQAQSNVSLSPGGGAGGPNSVQIKAGTLLYIDWTKVNRDPTKFPEPDQVKLDRNPSLYKLAESGIRSTRDESLSTPIAVGIAKEVFRLVNLSRAPGDAGSLLGLKEVLPGHFETNVMYIHQRTLHLTFFPQSMVVSHGGREDEHVWDLFD
ncbi:hypothetical protein JCM5350_003254 [Sporobolomyces pararoseus]